MSEGLAGFIVGALMIGLAWAVWWFMEATADLQKCAQQHNVYRCEKLVEFKPIVPKP